MPLGSGSSGTETENEATATEEKIKSVKEAIGVATRMIDVTEAMLQRRQLKMLPMSQTKVVTKPNKK